MRPRSRAIVAVLAGFLLCLPLSVQPAGAQSQDGPVILIIDMEKIRRDASAVRLLQRQMDQKRSAYQSELQSQEQELRKADQELTRQRSILSAEAFTQRRKEMEHRVAAMQQAVQRRRRELEGLFKQGMAEVQKRLEEIVRDIAKDHKADLVLTKALVVLVKPEMEITRMALDRLNAVLPEVFLEEPAN